MHQLSYIDKNKEICCAEKDKKKNITSNTLLCCPLLNGISQI
jgi:hypothetical protein